MTTAVRHCMEYRFQKFDTSKTTNTLLTSKGSMKDPLETILESTYLMNINENDKENEDISNLISSFIKNPESVLQELDIQRLRAIIYRDVVRQDRSKTGKNIVVVVVNQAFLFAFCVFCINCFILFWFFFNTKKIKFDFV
jgi:uncharacterized membrane protein YdbT with pleckstrin-like domain